MIYKNKVVRDENGRLVKLGRDRYYYDEKGNLDHINVSSFRVGKESYKYDAANRIKSWCIEERYWSDHWKNISSDFQYFDYDEHGNWRKRICKTHEDGWDSEYGSYSWSGKLIVEHEIEYYDE